jgi:hypothetical protein
VKRIWLLGLVLVLVMGPSSVAWARPVSTFEVDLDVSGSGGWTGYLRLAAGEDGSADVDLSLSRMGPVGCPSGEAGFAVETLTYRGVGSGTVAVERKLASLQYSADVDAVHTVIDGCGGEIVNTGVTLKVGAVATGDLLRGRVGDARVLSRLSQGTIDTGAVAVAGGGLVSEVISRG